MAASLGHAGLIAGQMALVNACSNLVGFGFWSQRPCQQGRPED
jgi:hypothetical protein